MDKPTIPAEPAATIPLYVAMSLAEAMRYPGDLQDDLTFFMRFSIDGDTYVFASEVDKLVSERCGVDLQYMGEFQHKVRG